MNEWHRYLPMVLLAVSLLFLAGGVFSILAAEFEWPYCMAERPHADLALCGFGIAGIAFLAWLKR